MRQVPVPHKNMPYRHTAWLNTHMYVEGIGGDGDPMGHVDFEM